MTKMQSPLYNREMCNLPINLCALDHLSTAVGNNECPNRYAAAANEAMTSGFTSGS